MQKPKMILFDYGQTLINEKKFDVLKGDEAVLKIAIKNPYNVNAEKLQDQADKIFSERIVNLLRDLLSEQVKREEN